MQEVKKKENFTSKGSDWALSIDGHDKLMGFQNWTFSLGIYGRIDISSRKILWLKGWVTNSKLEAISRNTYTNAVAIVPAYIHIDKGTTYVVMSTIHAY